MAHFGTGRIFPRLDSVAHFLWSRFLDNFGDVGFSQMARCEYRVAGFELGKSHGNIFCLALDSCDFFRRVADLVRISDSRKNGQERLVVLFTVFPFYWICSWDLGACVHPLAVKKCNTRSRRRNPFAIWDLGLAGFCGGFRGASLK